MAGVEDSCELGTGVLYSCTQCCLLHPITRLYYCQTCPDLVCSACVSPEIDSYYCPNCFENMPSSEAMLYLNRCSKCFECPRCDNTMSTLLSASQLYYLLCPHCQWSSLECGITSDNPRNLFIDFIKRERASEEEKEVQNLIDHYQKAQVKQIQAKKKAAISRRQLSLTMPPCPPLSSLKPISPADVEAQQDQKAEDRKPKLSAPSVESLEAEGVPQYLLDELDSTSLTTLNQRLNEPARQPALLSDALPRRKHLLTKKSKRCKDCKVLMVKPEINPSSIKFKKQTFAIDYVPRITITGRPDGLRVGVENKIVIGFSNPLEAGADITLARILHDGTDHFGEVQVPEQKVFVGGFNEVVQSDEIWADDDSKAVKMDSDDPNVIAERKINSVGIYITVKPAAPTQSLKVLLKVGVTYAGEKSEKPIEFIAHLNLGATQPSE